MIAFRRRKRTLPCNVSVARLVLRLLPRFMRQSLRVALLLCGYGVPVLLARADAPTSAWARFGADGKLAYRSDERGNTIPDFSRAGYGGGGVKLPGLPVVETLSPAVDGDDGARIQAALDRVAQRKPDARGWRGAVLLSAGSTAWAERWSSQRVA
jgi:hypothetical protein